jgi:uncharacterized protein YjlB
MNGFQEVVMLLSHVVEKPTGSRPATEIFHLAPDGAIPNSKKPVLVYRGVFSQRAAAGAQWLEKRFADNGWIDAWRWTVYPFHHFHSNTHEVLGVFSGKALLQIGGERGPEVDLGAGDVLVIPAGVAHRKLHEADGFQVVGAYPEGREPDMRTGLESERKSAEKTLSGVPMPAADPVFGTQGLRVLWLHVDEPRRHATATTER